MNYFNWWSEHRTLIICLVLCSSTLDLPFVCYYHYCLILFIVLFIVLKCFSAKLIPSTFILFFCVWCTSNNITISLFSSMLELFVWLFHEYHVTHWSHCYLHVVLILNTGFLFVACYFIIISFFSFEFPIPTYIVSSYSGILFLSSLYVPIVSLDVICWSFCNCWIHSNIYLEIYITALMLFLLCR